MKTKLTPSAMIFIAVFLVMILGILTLCATPIFAIWADPELALKIGLTGGAVTILSMSTWALIYKLYRKMAERIDP
jgi:ABC-type Mn2+/Zn2+ transport system permease subunit